MNYGFTIADNSYDCFELKLNLDYDVTELTAQSMIEESLHDKTVKLKRDQINESLLSFLRIVCQKSFNQLNGKSE